MKLNGIGLVSYKEKANEVTFTLECGLADALALDGQKLTITSQDSDYKVYAGYNVMSVGIQGEYTQMRAYRKLEPDTAAAINAADANANAAIARADALAAENAELQAQVEEQAGAITELAEIVAGMGA